MRQVTAIYATPIGSAFAPTGPCPDWCAYGGECGRPRLYDDRRHLSASVFVQLSTEPSGRSVRVSDVGIEEYDTPQELLGRLDQHCAEAEPVVSIYAGECNVVSDFSVGLTLDEAEEFARGILEMVDAGRPATGTPGRRRHRRPRRFARNSR
jgi:hypothetical protein